MQITVVHSSCGSVKIYDVEGENSSTHHLKKVIFDAEGIPVEYQRLYRGETELSSDVPLSSSDELRLMVELRGGDPHFKTTDFVCYFRCMCCFSGIDGDWKSCQWFCLKCGI
jgi:hypothetical protein